MILNRHLSPDQSPKALNDMKTLNTLSLPEIKKASRDLVNVLLRGEKEKIKQKLKLNYYPHDISYLKDKTLSKTASNSLPSFLYTDIKDIYTKVYNVHDIDLNFLSPENTKKNKQSSINFIEQILTTPKPALEFQNKFQITAPTGRQETMNLDAWVNLMDQKYIQKFKDLLVGKGDINRNKVLEAWKAIYVTGIKEIQRQVTVTCKERGNLLEKIAGWHDQIYEFNNARTEIEINRRTEIHLKEMNDLRALYCKELAYYQVNNQSLDKEASDLKHLNHQLQLKIHQLERQIEDFKRNDKIGIKSGTKLNTLKYNPNNFDEFIPVEQEKNFNVPVVEKLSQEIEVKLKKLQNIKGDIKKKKNSLKDIEIDVIDKQCLLATVNFEIELKQNTIRPIAKYSPKNLSSLLKEKTPFRHSPRLKTDNELNNSQKFFKNLLQKPKNKLIQKGKILQDHIFQSLTVIYNRAIIQIDLFSEKFDFQYLVYKQFVKPENNRKTEKSLKTFISGCLKYSEFKRISVFLRHLNLGDFIDKKNLSLKTFQLYLSAYFYMQNSDIGILTHSGNVNPIQYYPLSRALSCLRDLKPLFQNKTYIEIESFLNTIRIQDPKQINPQGLIELEAFLEKICEENEVIYTDISQNCAQLLCAVSDQGIVPKDLFTSLIFAISPEKIFSDGDKELLESFSEVKPSNVIDLCVKNNILSTEDISTYLGDLNDLSENLGKELLLTQLPSVIGPPYKWMLENIENIKIKFALVWWKLFNNIS
jgi:hypothetical protein